MSTHAAEDDEFTCCESADTSVCVGPETEVRELPEYALCDTSVVVFDSASSDSMSFAKDG